MRRLLASALLTGLVAACAAHGSPPAGVASTLTAIEALGPTCGEGTADHVPSGLTEWSCRGEMMRAAVTVLVDGNDEGVAGVTLVVADSTDPALTTDRFGRLVDAVPPLRTAPILKEALAGWAGSQRTRVIGGVRISAECGASQCLVIVMPAENALRPLPLP